MYKMHGIFAWDFVTSNANGGCLIALTFFEVIEIGSVVETMHILMEVLDLC